MKTYESRFSCITTCDAFWCNRRAPRGWLYWIVASPIAKLVQHAHVVAGRSPLKVSSRNLLGYHRGTWQQKNRLSPRGWRVAALNISNHGDPQAHQVRPMFWWNTSFGPYDFRKLMRNIDVFFWHWDFFVWHISFYEFVCFSVFLKPATYPHRRRWATSRASCDWLCWLVVFFQHCILLPFLHDQVTWLKKNWFYYVLLSFSVLCCHYMFAIHQLLLTFRVGMWSMTGFQARKVADIHCFECYSKHDAKGDRVSGTWCNELRKAKRTSHVAELPC